MRLEFQKRSELKFVSRINETQILVKLEAQEELSRQRSWQGNGAGFETELIYFFTQKRFKMMPLERMFTGKLGQIYGIGLSRF